MPNVEHIHQASGSTTLIGNVYTAALAVRELAVVLSDTDHEYFYSGSCATMVAGDKIVVVDTSISKCLGGYIYETTNLSEIKADTAAILIDTATTIPATIVALPTDADVQTACDSAITANTDINNIDTGVNNLETACIDNATGADIAADIIALKAETVSILADTNELQSDDIPTTLAVIQAITDQINFTGTYVNASVVGGSMGTGSSTVNYYVYTDEDAKTDPIALCAVWVSTDSAGNTVVASGQTDADGLVTFYLNPDVYYFWRSKSGYSFTNPDTETVA